MNRRTIAISAMLVLVTTVLVGGPVAAKADRQTVAVVWHPQSGLAGPVGDGAGATVVRRPDGVSLNFRTTRLQPGHAYTLWFIVLNEPSACAATPCSAPDILLNPATEAQITRAAGHVVGAGGNGAFASAFRVGALDGWLSGGELTNPLTAEIQLVLNDHGPVLAGYLPGMIHTYRAGCTDASLPTIFPASAKADGTPGPNTCLLYQAAVFAGS